MREALKAPRAVVAMERYLDGEEVGLLRRRLAISRMRWQEWYSAFLEVVARCDEDPLVLSQDLLYERFNHPDYAFPIAQVRGMVEADPPPKKTGRIHQYDQDGRQGSQDAPDRAHHS